MAKRWWFVILCAAVAQCLPTASAQVRADTGTLPVVKSYTASGMAGQTVSWPMGDVNTLYNVKVSATHSLPALLTWSWLPYPSEFPKYTSTTILFGNGYSRTRNDFGIIWEVAQATPSLYLVLASMGHWAKPEGLGVTAIDTYHFTVRQALLITAASDAKLQCGVVFALDGRHYTVRGRPQFGEVHTDLTHALVRGLDTCS